MLGSWISSDVSYNVRSRIGKPSVTEKELEGKNRLLFCLVHDVIAQDWITAQKRKHMAAVIQGSKVAKFLDR